MSVPVLSRANAVMRPRLSKCIPPFMRVRLRVRVRFSVTLGVRVRDTARVRVRVKAFDEDSPFGRTCQCTDVRDRGTDDKSARACHHQ